MLVREMAGVLHSVTPYFMARKIMTVRVEPRTRKALDGIATALDRDRTYVVNQTLEAYIDVHH